MNWYVLRLTLPDKDACETISMLQTISSIGAHIVTGHEYSRDNVEHTHSVIGTYLKIDTFRQSLKKILGITKAKDEGGNKIYSMKNVTDLKGAVQYAIKSNDYTVTTDFPQEVLQWAIDNPWIFPERPEDFDHEYNSIDIEYINTQLSDYDYVDMVLKLYSKHKRGFALHHIKSRWLKNANIRNAEFNPPYDKHIPPKTIRENLIWSILRI